MVIRAMRIKRGLTLEALAKKSGVSRVSINRYELGDRVPDVTTAKKIADALSCTIEEILADEKDGEGEAV